MATTPFFAQQFHFLDGALAAGGKLYAYLQGTATPATLYLDPTFATAAPYPLVLGADGLAPQYFVPSTVGIRLKLMDPRTGVDTIVWTRDYIVSGGNGSGGGNYLPLAGGTMAAGAQIQWPNDDSNSALYFGSAVGKWTNYTRDQWYFAPTATRGGGYFQAQSYGAFLSLMNPGNVSSVDLYGFPGGGYLTLKNSAGNDIVALGSTGSEEYGQLTLRNGAAAGRLASIRLNGGSGEARVGSIWTGQPDYGVERIDELGDAYLRNLSLSGLTNGTIPIVSTAGGLLGDSSLTEGATSLTSSGKTVKLRGNRAALGGQLEVGGGAGGNAGTMAFGRGSDGALGAMLGYTAGANENQEFCFKSVGTNGAFFSWYCRPSSAAIERMRLSANGGLSIGTTADPGTGALLLTAQASQWSTELVTSGRYAKTTDTTIGPSAAAKASLLNGATSGFTAVTDPANRWNAVGAASETTLKGNVSSVANQVLVFELYRGGVSVATMTLPARNYGTSTPWRLVIDQVVRVAGSSGTVRVKIRAYITADNVNAQASCYDVSATLTGIDLTAASTWDVVCTIPNNASNSIFCDYAKKVG